MIDDIANCGLRVIDDISRNIVKMREIRSPDCGFHVVDDISRNFIEKYAKGRLRSVGFTSSTILRAISLRLTRSAVSQLWTARRQLHFTQFHCDTSNAVSKLWISRCQRYFAEFHGATRNAVCKLRNFGLSMVFHAISLRYGKCRPRTACRALSIVFQAISLGSEKCRLQTADFALSVVYRAI